MAAPSLDDLRRQLDETIPLPSAAAPASTPGKPAAQAAEGPSIDDLRRQMEEIAPVAKEAAGTTEPPAGIGIGGAPAESAVQTVRRWSGAGGQPAQSSALADVITSPEAQAADIPQSQTPGPSDQQIRSALAPAPNTTYGDILPLARDDKTGDVRFAMPNMLRSPLIGLTSGTGANALTIDPATGAVRLTPEAQAAGSLVANPLKFSGGNALMRDAVSPLTLTKPLPVTMEELNAAIARADASPAGGPTAAERAAAREQPQGESAESIAASGGYRTQPGGTKAEGGAVQPAGAQVTPTYEAIHTPAEEAAYRATAEGNKLLENQIIGERDNNSYVPGVTPNAAELEQRVAAARDMKQLGIQSQEASEMARRAAQDNNTARREYLLNTEKTPVDIHNREVAREADLNRQAEVVFSPDNVKGEVSMEPLISQMKREMGLPRNRQNTALQSEFGDLIKRLTNEDGTAKAMGPEEAWGLRQDIDRMTDKQATTGIDPQSRNRRRVAGQLDRVAGTLDEGIETVAPGYSEMLATYRTHSNAIREMEVLQGLTAKLSNGPGGTLSYSAMQRFMKNVVDSRATGSQDLNPYKSLSPETMQRLWNLRDDLRRTAGAIELARAAGSDTAQNILDVLKAWGKIGGQAAAHAGAAKMFGPAGPIALRMAQETLGPVLSARRAARTERLNVESMQRMLNPGTPLRPPPGQENPLQP